VDNADGVEAGEVTRERQEFFLGCASILRRCLIAVSCIPAISPSPLLAGDACRLLSLAHEQKDVATIDKIEKAWTVAFLRGDTQFERCLLTSDFTEIMRHGNITTLVDELRGAAENREKNMPIPEFPEIQVLLHGNVAVAYGTLSATGSARKARARYADYYVWENGGWQAFFARQTPIEER
jgi:ketosteroid isomerase-like protein